MKSIRTNPSNHAPEGDERCGNCTRERVKDDLFWHADDQHWYCKAVWECQHRLIYLWERGDDEDIAAIENRRDASGVTWL